MRICTRVFCLLFCGSLLSLPDANAQVVPRFGAHLMAGVPVSEFADNVDNWGFGIGLNGGIGLGSAPVMIGLDLGYLIYGFERRSEPFSTTIPDVTVDVETTNNITLVNLFLRFQPQQGMVRPYVEGLFGLKYLFTRTSVENRSFDEEIAASINFDDVASSFGAGAGVEFRVFEGINENNNDFAILVSAGVKYLLGSSAEYLERGSTSRENGELIFDVTKSRTDMVIPHLGASFTF